MLGSHNVWRHPMKNGDFRTIIDHANLAGRILSTVCPGPIKCLASLMEMITSPINFPLLVPLLVVSSNMQLVFLNGYYQSTSQWHLNLALLMTPMLGGIQRNMGTGFLWRSLSILLLFTQRTIHMGHHFWKLPSSIASRVFLLNYCISIFRFWNF